MAFTLTAPYPGYQTASTLPNPTWGDSEGVLTELTIKKSIDGTTRTYVKRKGRRSLSWTFTLTRNKAMEVREFIRAYQSSKIGIIDHNDRSWLGYVMNNPLEITMEKRGNPARQGLPQGEMCSVTIEFEGIQLTDEPRASKTFVIRAASELEVNHTLGLDLGLPNVAGLSYNWDATGITGLAHGAKVSSWVDAGPYSIPLIPRPASDVSGGIDPTIDCSPRYHTDIFGLLPGVYFGSVSGVYVTTTASMWSTTDSVSLFPNRRGTVFFVHQHAEGGDPRWAQDSREFGLWSMKVSDHITESFNAPGGTHSDAPATWRTYPEEGTSAIGDPGELPYLVQGQSYVNMIQRDSDATIRWRINGQEMNGRTIPNNPGSVGRLRLCQSNGPILRGFFGHFLVYNKVLNEPQVAEVEAYLMHKWGVLAQL